MNIEEADDKYEVFDDLVDDEEDMEEEEGDQDNIGIKKDILLTEKQFDDIQDKLETAQDDHQPIIEKKVLDTNCTLETIIKEGLDMEDYRIDINKKIEEPAKKYKFELDHFQKAAVQSIHNNTSILVAAHTSAGKTAVAEYVIAKCLANNQRVIYTSPIKALSNQKYRDLKEEFGCVGLVTGDVTIDETQTCLVMTTEILRNMLFRSNEVAKETAWIIFDEVHYLKDRDRGVIWEETIILAPKNVRYCLLSATTPNASELAQWILKVKQLNCINVVYTDFRPTPLEYFAYKSGDKKLLLMKDRHGKFLNNNFEKISKNIDTEEDDDKKKKPVKKKKQNHNKGDEIKKIIKIIKNKEWAPCIIFAFSKKEVELLAKKISKDMKLLAKDEISTLKGIYQTTISGLSEEDQKLPQITSLLEIITAGVGLHHGGMLPILKELIELLFQMGLIKVLVSTETFSMGVNMPAKCVVFSSVQKFDGEIFRVLSGSEFVQMSGRAGRRGKDKRGVVITMVDESTDMKQYSLMLNTESKHDPLISQFDISYNMLLNSFLLEGFEPEFMIEKSFKQFQHDIKKNNSQNLIGNWRKKVKALDEELFSKDKEKFKTLLQMFDANKKIKKIEKRLNEILLEPTISLKYLSPGRLIFVEGLGWVTFINFTKTQGRIIIDVLSPLNFVKNKKIRKKVFCSCKRCVKKHNFPEAREPKVIDLELSYVRSISQVVIKMPTDLKARENRITITEIVDRAIQKYKHELPLMNLVKEIDIPSKQLKDEVIGLQAEYDELLTLACDLEDKHYDLVKDKIKAEETVYPFVFENIINLEKEVGDDLETSELFYSKEALNLLFIPKQYETKLEKKHAEDISIDEITSIKLFIKFSKKVKKVLEDDNSLQNALVLKNKIESMKVVLKRLNFIDLNGVPTSKGRIASLIFGSDEILLTELLFMNQLTKLTPKQIDIILSLFINEERKNEKNQVKIRDEAVRDAYEEIQKTLSHIYAVYTDAGIEDVKEDDIHDKLNTSLFDVISKWYDGCNFLEVCKITDMYEGSIIRGIKRLYELLKQLSDCSKNIGNKELMEKFEEASQKLYRGIIFAASLYL